MTTRELRAAFWRQLPPPLRSQRKPGGQNNQNTTIRTMWCDYVEYKHRNGEISDRVAQGATL